MVPLSQANIEQRLAALHSKSWGWALCCCRGDKALAEEVLQTAYLRLLERGREFRGESRFQTWVFGFIRLTTLELSRSSIRWQQRHQTINETEQGHVPHPGARLEASELRQEFLTHLQALSPRQGEVLHLVFYQHLSLPDAAQVMEISIGAASQHYHRAKSALKKRLARAQEEARL